jgi:hypothetical protein
MAKVSKSLLKEIVKECLVEILAEGLSGGNSTDLNESIQNKSKSLRSSSSRIMKSMLPVKDKVVNENFEENTKKVIANVTSDPIMAELLADTASTTLQEQNSADNPNKFSAKPTDSASMLAADNDPSELFGEASSKWAHLAFAGAEK